MIAHKTLVLDALPRRAPKPAPAAGLVASTVEQLDLDVYRFLYREVGRPWGWVSRLDWSDHKLGEAIHSPSVEIEVLFADEQPVGFAEFELGARPVVELRYFGLIATVIGRGWGAFLLDWSVRRIWRHEPRQLRLTTRSTDHPNALRVYEEFGFAKVPAEGNP